MKLTAKLVFLVFLAVALLTAGMGYLAVQRQFEDFKQRHEEPARQLKAKMGDAPNSDWHRLDSEGIAETIASLDVEIQYTRIRWVRFDVDAAHPDSPHAPRHQLGRVIQGQIDSVVIPGDQLLQTYLPMKMPDGTLGGVELSDSLEALDAMRNRTVWSTLWALAAMAAACVGVVLIAGIQVVGRRLEKLIEKTKRIGMGDFSGPVTLSGNDELSELAQALNEMSEQLAAQQETIQTAAASRIATLNQLRHADRLKTVGRLAAGIAHELGTPLNVVSGRAGLIAGGKLAADEVRQSAAAIKAEADRITQIIRQLLDFARRSSPQHRQMDLATVVDRTVELLRTMAEKRNVTIQVDSSGCPLTARIDDGQIQQVLTNIVMNAMQSMPDGGRVTIRLGARQAVPPADAEAAPGEYLFVQVADTGTGIAAENLEHIFEPFFTTKGVGEGTGLGLSIAYGIIREHGGWIDVDSQLGGSCFTIFLPKEDATCTAEC